MRSALVLAFALVLTSCATTPSPQVELASQVAIQLATGKFIESSSNPAARAERVAQIATQVKALAAGDTSTVDALNEYVENALASANVHLEPSDRILINTLVAAVVDELHRRVSNGVLSDKDKLIVSHVLDWIIEASEVYSS